jgi:hypothetical protein
VSLNLPIFLPPQSLLLLVSFNLISSSLSYPIPLPPDVCFTSPCLSSFLFLVLPASHPPCLLLLTSVS